MNPNFFTSFAMVMTIPAVGIGVMLLWFEWEDRRERNRKKARKKAKKEKKRLKALHAG
jgi:hypothetical protein